MKIKHIINMLLSSVRRRKITMKALKLTFAISVCFTFGMLMRMTFLSDDAIDATLHDSNHGSNHGNNRFGKVQFIPRKIGSPITFTLTLPPKLRHIHDHNIDELGGVKNLVRNISKEKDGSSLRGEPSSEMHNNNSSGPLKPSQQTPADPLSHKRINVVESSNNELEGVRKQMVENILDGLKPDSDNALSANVGGLTRSQVVPENNIQDNIGMSMKEFFQENFQSLYHTREYYLEDDLRYYVRKYPGQVQCLVEGADLLKTQMRKSGDCVCKPGWYGGTCSMPASVFSSGYPYEYGVLLLKKPRRIIYGMPFNHEFDLLEAKVHELQDVVDVFLILESNYTAAGKGKRRHLKESLDNGYLAEFQERIVYISLDYFPREAYINGWKIDALLRNYIGYVGLEKVLKNVRPDDIFVAMDVDEIPSRETLLFLKLHTGYPQPVGWLMRHNVYGFFWSGREDNAYSEIYGAVTVSLLQHVLAGNVYEIRSSRNSVFQDGAKLKKYKREFDSRLKPWLFGSKEAPAGWHCSWCFTPQGIQTKMLSAHSSDNPRWGTMVEKTDLSYIQHLVSTGTWFDNKVTFQNLYPKNFYAPSWVLKNHDRFAYLLINKPLSEE